MVDGIRNTGAPFTGCSALPTVYLYAVYWSHGLSPAPQVGGNQDHNYAQDEGHEEPRPPAGPQRFEQLEGDGESQDNTEEGEGQEILRARNFHARPHGSSQ